MGGWTYVLFAAIIEVVWVLGLKYSDNLWMWTGTVFAIVLSFYFIIRACELLPSGSVYATFTGSGAAAIAMIDFTFLGEAFSIAKGFFILLVIIGVIGIQLTTGEKAKPEESMSTVKEGEL